MRTSHLESQRREVLSVIVAIWMEQRSLDWNESPKQALGAEQDHQVLLVARVAEHLELTFWSRLDVLRLGLDYPLVLLDESVRSLDDRHSFESHETVYEEHEPSKQQHDIRSCEEEAVRQREAHSVPPQVAAGAVN